MINFLKKFSLIGKRAVVAGGAGLLGKEVVIVLAQAGAKVVIADINELQGKKLANKLKKFDVQYRYLDIADITSLKNNINSLVEFLGGIDAWVNSAYPRTKDFAGPVENITVESWRKNVDIQLNSYALISKYVAECMKKRGGSIINFGSIYGVVGNDPNLYKNTALTSSMAYATIKGGIVNLGRFLAAYFGPYNIRVNTVCPGGVLHKQDPIFVEKYAKRTPLGRMAYAQDIAPLVAFLASEASSYITGATIMVDGGWTAV